MVRRRCIILIPTAFNDGTEVPSALMRQILREFDERFDGHTIAGTVSGTYRMSDGSFAEDDSLEVWVAVEEGQIPALEDMVRTIARRLKQETVYFEILQSEVRLVTPDDGEAEAQ